MKRKWSFLIIILVMITVICAGVIVAFNIDWSKIIYKYIDISDLDDEMINDTNVMNAVENVVPGTDTLVSTHTVSIIPEESETANVVDIVVNEKLQAVHVIDVLNGTTMIIVDDENIELAIRLYGLTIDEYIDDEAFVKYAEASKSLLEEYIQKYDAIYIEETDLGEDEYGLPYVKVWLYDSIDDLNSEEMLSKYLLNSILIREGAAFVDKKAPDSQLKDLLFGLQNKAIEENIGLWRYEKFKDFVSLYL